MLRHNVMIQGHVRSPTLSHSKANHVVVSLCLVVSTVQRFWYDGLLEWLVIFTRISLSRNSQTSFRNITIYTFEIIEKGCAI